MVRRVFFSFHYDRDIWRVSQVRQSWVTKGSYEEAGYVDAASWETLKKKGDDSIKRWIDRELKGTSVLAVLIGSTTYGRKWVNYEMKQSYAKNKGMLGIYIHNLKNQDKQTEVKGKNPFTHLSVKGKSFSDMYPTYDWVNDTGHKKLGDWIDEAADKAGR